MNWTTDVPTEEGYYLNRIGGDDSLVFPREVYRDAWGWLWVRDEDSGDDELVTALNGEWQGPLAPQEGATNVD
jgi:hypothetical protein